MTDGTVRGKGLRREAYALLADGVIVLIRPARPGDLDAVRQMHEAMSQDNTYLRFFGLSRAAAGQEARRVCRTPSADCLALLAWHGADLVGVASYEPALQPQTAEIAFAVADHAHRRGVAMLLLEHLVSAARSQGIRTFTAQTLAENYAMLKVFASTGLRARRHLADGVTELTFDLPRDDADPGWDRYLDAVASRESHADAGSLRHLLAPESVALIGASRRAGSPGQVILRNIISAGYRGRLYAVSAPAGQPGRAAPGVFRQPA
jgi:GNAT superfamily N-acetyltransferase